jgi:corrinoid protein of di/trimethylamine methyltransferase
MDTKQILINAVKSGEIEKSLELTTKALGEGVSATEVVNSLTGAIREVGDAFEKFDIFLPQMMMASEAMIEIMKVLEPKIKEESSNSEKRGAKIVMATVKGDIHEIGKDIVILLLRANRFDVLDMGGDVDSLEIVKTAEREKANFIGLSALMTTTMLGQKEVIEILKKKGLRDKFKVIIGGAPTSQNWADNIGADAWAGDASNAVRTVENLIKIDKGV